MIETLLITLIILAIVNIVIGLKKKVSFDIKPQLKEVEESIFKFDTTLERTEKSIKDEFQRNRKETSETSQTNRGELTKSLKAFEDNFSENIKKLNDLLRQNFGDFNKQQIDLNKQATDNIKNVEKTIEKNLKSIREDNTIQLSEMRKTVDEKLQTTLEKRLGESFKQVSDRLEQVHKGLGEMQNIATGVGDLKKVLSNVKTRGVLGEYQLENILEQILTPDQYAKNVATKKGSQANVEFALKLPGKEAGKEVWLPIDSKFPIEDYDRLLDAFDKGEKEGIESAQKVLIKKIESFAKSISEKYIDPPHTTDFGIMFLPVESLYAEVLRHPGLFEILQRKYKITVTGPTTLSALLNSLQMGFRTLAVQKRSSEVWDILKAVKFEFKEFSGVLTKVHKQLNTASGTLDTLRTTRTNVMERKLKDVETFTALESKEILELPDNNLIEKSNEE
jgi:DNA recombination protein RmuC|tara:strand:+ start:33 stop:1379 length:1347 start_codon:yes stop_codon:yes gene_type:complete